MTHKVGTDNFHKYLCSLDYYNDFNESHKNATHLNLEIEN